MKTTPRMRYGSQMPPQGMNSLTRTSRPPDGEDDQQHDDHHAQDDGHQAVDGAAGGRLDRAGGLVADGVDQIDDAIGRLGRPVAGHDLAGGSAGGTEAWCSDRG